MKKSNLILLAMLLLIACNKRQEYIDVTILPKANCVNSNWMNFWKDNQSLLVLPDDTLGLRVINEKWTIKLESELTEDDYLKPMCIQGIISKFKNWEKFNSPVKSIKNGFEFNGIKYNGKDDGLFLKPYENCNKYIFIGNSTAYFKRAGIVVPSYDYKTVVDDQLMHFGNLHDSVFIIELNKIRESNYIKKKTTYYDIYVSKKIKENEEPVDKIVIDICQKMELPYPEFKIRAYMHHNANEARLFANFFGMAGCDILDSTFSFGTVEGRNIHNVGNGTELLKHESFHILWNELVGGRSYNPFYVEGIQKYYEFLNDSSKFSASLSIAKKHQDYDITDWIIKGSAYSFWGGPAENNSPIAYDISGLFVKVLIDNWGLEKFKEFYKIPNKQQAFKEVYGVNVEEIISKYRQMLEI